MAPNFETIRKQIRKDKSSKYALIIAKRWDCYFVQYVLYLSYEMKLNMTTPLNYPKMLSYIVSVHVNSFYNKYLGRFSVLLPANSRKICKFAVYLSSVLLNKHVIIIWPGKLLMPVGIQSYTNIRWNAVFYLFLQWLKIFKTSLKFFHWWKIDIGT